MGMPARDYCCASGTPVLQVLVITWPYNADVKESSAGRAYTLATRIRRAVLGGGSHALPVDSRAAMWF